MITPQGIKKKAERKYVSFLQNRIQKLPFEPIIIRGDKTYTKSSLAEFKKEISSIIFAGKSKKGFGYSIDFKQVKTKYLSVQDLPHSIYFESEQDYLKYLGKEQEVIKFKKNINKILSEFLELKQWLLKKPKKVIENLTKWEDILKVCRYFKENPKPNLYIRELPIKVHTKFIEQNQAIIKDVLGVIIADSINRNEKNFEKRFHLKYAEPQVRFRILDNNISQRFFLGIDDIAIPISHFRKLKLPIKRVLVVENKTSLYTTLTLPKMENTIAIFGGGYGVTNLKEISWFRDIKLLYWGDFDVHGFEILSQFRSYYAHTKSVFMDKATFDKFFDDDEGKPSNTSLRLNLTDVEQELYNQIKVNNWRLEQEKIPLDYVCETLQRMVTVV